MRKFIAVSSLIALSLAWSDAAHAGKKSEPAADAGAAAPTADMYAMEPTGIAELDTFFARAQAPLDTLAAARTSIYQVNTSLVSALGLKEGTPFKDALADLQAKGGDGISVALNGAMPSLKASDAAPANVVAAVDATNAAFAAAGAAGAALVGIAGLPEQFAALIDEGKTFADPAKLKSMVSNPTQLPKATSKTGKNLSTLAKAKDEPAALKTSMETLVSDTMGAFK